MYLFETYPPLISSRSPSYERARREFLHPRVTAHPQVIAVLARLSEAEYDASKACTTIAGVLTHGPFADLLREHAATHEGRREALGTMITDLRGSPPRADESRGILDRTRAAVEQARTDAAAMLALHVMRDELSAAYHDATESPDIDDAQRSALLELAPPVAPVTAE